MSTTCHSRPWVAAVLATGLALSIGYNVYQWRYDPAVAEYNDRSIRASQLDGELRARFGEEVLQEMITQDLVDAALAQNAINISDTELKLWVNDYLERPDAQEIVASNQMDLPALRRNLAKTVPLYYLAVHDMTEEDLKAYFTSQRARFEEMVMRHILLGSEEEAKSLLPRIKSEDSFTALASVHSLDTATYACGGSLGRVTRQELIDSFGEEKAGDLFRLEPGQISDPIQADSGAWHIFYVVSKTTDFDSLRRRVIEELALSKLGQVMQNLREQAHVKILLQESAANGQDASESASAADQPKKTGIKPASPSPSPAAEAPQEAQPQAAASPKKT